MKRRIGSLCLLSLAATAAATPARAEVSAETDSSGAYVRTVVMATSSTKNVRIWSKVTSRPNMYPLNPDGDRAGDLWPTVAEQLAGVRRPWVVWSRFTGAGYDLAWSHFNAPTRAWVPPAWVESVGSEGADLDPSLAFDSTGRPFLTWWRDDAGTGRIFLSLFLETRWMTPFEVSDEGVDSVSPTVTMLADDRIEVRYTTPAGTVVRVVQFNRPLTITDDATPFGRLAVSSTMMLSSR